MMIPMNPFEKILSSLQGKKDTGVVGVDIGSAFIKAIQVHKKGGKAVLDTYGEIALGPLAGLEVGQVTQLANDKIAEAATDLFKEAKITGKDMVIGLPLTSALLTVVEMPDLGEEKLKEMIPIEARKYVPTATSEVSLNWWVIPKQPLSYVDPDVEERMKQTGPMVDVLLAAVHNDVIARYQDIGKRLGATSVSFEIEVFSSIRAALGHDTNLTLLLDFGAGNTKVTIVDGSVIRSSHLVNVGAQDVTLALSRSRGIPVLDAEELKREKGLPGDPQDPSIAEVTRLSVERIMAEVNRIYSKYQRDKHVTISKIVLTGGGALLKGFPELVTQMFPETKVESANVFEKLDAPAVLAELLKEAGPEFAVALGLALRKL